MNLDDSIPDHSVLSKARTRWGEEVFEIFFVRIVKQCVEAGLVEGSKIHMDGSLIDANASKDSVVTSSPELIMALKEAFKVEQQKLAPPLGQPNYHAQNDKILSTTDPDAPCIRNNKKGASGGSRPRYKHHRAVDDKLGVITGVKTTPGDREENSQVEVLIDKHQSNTGKRVETVIGDRQYGTVDNYRTLQKRGIQTHMGQLQRNNNHLFDKIYGPEHFKYDKEQDIYICPAGQNMYPRRYNKRRRSTEYLTRKGVCDQCPLRPHCTSAKLGRSIARHYEHELIEEARRQAHSNQARKDLNRRRHLMEGSFADATQHHFKRSRWRRLGRQTIQDLIIATVQNIKIMLRHGKSPQGTALGLFSLAYIMKMHLKTAFFAVLLQQAAVCEYD